MFLEVTNMELANEALLYQALAVFLLLLLIIAIVVWRYKVLKLQHERDTLLIKQLENELIDFQSVLEQNSQLNNALLDPLRKRSEMLDRFLLSRLAENPQIGKDFQDWMAKLTDNREQLLREMRNSLQATYPLAYNKFVKAGLTETELSFICLYAAGLRGTEVGHVMETKRHYIISHEIRRKLGLDSTSQNLGPFIKSVLDGNK